MSRRARSVALGVLVFAIGGAIASTVVTDGTFVSSAPTGTPPLTVASSTKVEHLNVDQLDGRDAAEFAPLAETYTKAQVVLPGAAQPSR